MNIDLSFTKDPGWREIREKQWEVIEAIESDEWTKKQLECRKRYFIDAELICQDNEKLRIIDGDLLIWFPLKTPEAWEYICRELMRGRRRATERTEYYSLLHGLVNSVVGDLREGWSHDEHCALFDWLMGERFEGEIVPPVPIGPRAIQPSHKLDPDHIYSVALSLLGRWLKGELVTRPVWVSRIDYFLGLIPFVDERAYVLDKFERNVRTKKGAVIVTMQGLLQRLLGFMKSYSPEGIPAEAVAERETFLDEFRQRLEAFEPKPGELTKLLEYYLK